MILPQLNPLHRSRSVPPSTHTAAVKLWLCSSSPPDTALWLPLCQAVQWKQDPCKHTCWTLSGEILRAALAAYRVCYEWARCKQDHRSVTLDWPYEQLDSKLKYLFMCGILGNKWNFLSYCSFSLSFIFLYSIFSFKLLTSFAFNSTAGSTLLSSFQSDWPLTSAENWAECLVMKSCSCWSRSHSDTLMSQERIPAGTERHVTWSIWAKYLNFTCVHNVHSHPHFL